jgi:hypothetical protein
MTQILGLQDSHWLREVTSDFRECLGIEEVLYQGIEVAEVTSATDAL